MRYTLQKQVIEKDLEAWNLQAVNCIHYIEFYGIDFTRKYTWSMIFYNKGKTK